MREPAKAKITWIMAPGTAKADFFIASNRGVTLYKNFVISVTGDCKILWTKADTGELDAPTLLRRTQLTFLDSALLLFLRQRLTGAEARGDRGVIAAPEILSHLTLYEHAVNTDKAGFNRRATASLKKKSGKKPRPSSIQKKLPRRARSAS